MAFFDVPHTAARLEPTSAERVRTILLAAQSMTVVTDEQRTDVSRSGGPALGGRIHLCPSTVSEPPADSDADWGIPPGGCVSATLEFTDIAPTAVRDRVRGRVTVSGWLAAADENDGNRCLEFSHAVLETSGQRTVVGLSELLEAQEDPLATSEASMLTHLVDDHDDVVALLLRLVDPRQIQGTLRALPLAIDRYGITLRLERATGHRDVRLPFPSPVDHADQAGTRIHTLLSIAHHSAHQRWSLSNP